MYAVGVHIYFMNAQDKNFKKSLIFLKFKTNVPAYYAKNIKNVFAYNTVVFFKKITATLLIA